MTKLRRCRSSARRRSSPQFRASVQRSSSATVMNEMTSSLADRCGRYSSARESRLKRNEMTSVSTTTGLSLAGDSSCVSPPDADGGDCAISILVRWPEVAEQSLEVRSRRHALPRGKQVQIMPAVERRRIGLVRRDTFASLEDLDVLNFHEANLTLITLRLATRECVTDDLDRRFGQGSLDSHRDASAKPPSGSLTHLVSLPCRRRNPSLRLTRRIRQRAPRLHTQPTGQGEVGAVGCLAHERRRGLPAAGLAPVLVARRLAHARPARRPPREDGRAARAVASQDV